MTTPVLHPFVKGHGAENDFVILPDPAGHLALTAAEAIRLCDRRTGLGADGILRAVRCAAEPEAAAMTDAEWFMDYRNADGTLGAMCGNGLRLLARYLVDAGHHQPGAFLIATRAGIRQVHARSTGPVTIDMGRPRLPGSGGIQVTAAGRTWSATHVDMGNPHAVVFLEDPRLAGDLRTAPTVTPAAAYPHGTTIEFVTTRSPYNLQLRVYERGVGETRACGTGACAAVAAARAQRARPPLAAHYTVDLPGGRLNIAVRPDGAMELTGPAVVTAQGTVSLTLPALEQQAACAAGRR
ncbi:diaminopimelate epimerase [Streptomyces sp. NPDC021354]|uniref:diaminopimelate epimerase n=1 Tax=Streptomyces sp. NPDC021354 TaxID=3154793 RepID=UPI003401449B